MNVEIHEPTEGSRDESPSHEVPSPRTWRDHWTRLQGQAGLTIVENLLIIGAALVILLALLAWFFPDVFQNIKDKVNDVLKTRDS